MQGLRDAFFRSLWSSRVHSLPTRMEEGRQSTDYGTTSLSRTLADRYALAAFFLLTLALSWRVWIPAALASQGIITFPLPAVVTGILGAFGPSLAGVIMTLMSGGWSGLPRLLRRIFVWRVGLPWYLLVFLWPALLSLSVTGLTILLGKPAPDFANPPFVTAYPIPSEALHLGWWIFLPFVFLQQMTIGSALGEEFGWRGYALPRLQASHSALYSSIILGLLWGIWHLPLCRTVGDARATLSVAVGIFTRG